MTTNTAPQSPAAGPVGLTYTVQETAALLGISPPSAYEGVHSGVIPSIKIGRRILVPRAALARLLEGAAA